MRCTIYKVEGWCPHCYEHVRGRSMHPGRRQPLPRLTPMSPEEEEEMAMRRADAPVSVAGLQANDEYLSSEFPALHSHLVEQVWDDKKPRVTSSIMLQTEGGRWKAWFHDRDAKMSAWVTGESWSDVLTAVEKGLTTGSLDWRKDKR